MDDSTLSNVLGTEIGGTTVGGLFDTVTGALLGSDSSSGDTVIVESSSPDWLPYAVVAGLVLSALALMKG